MSFTTYWLIGDVVKEVCKTIRTCAGYPDRQVNFVPKPIPKKPKTQLDGLSDVVSSVEPKAEVKK